MFILKPTFSHRCMNFNGVWSQSFTSSHISSTLSLYFRDVLVPWVNKQTEIWHKDLHCVRIIANVATCFLHSVLLATERQHFEKNVELGNHFSDRTRHMKMLLLVWKITETYQPGWDSENPFLTAPQELSRSIINYSHRRTQEIWGSACLLSSFAHDLSSRGHFNSSDSTVINELISISVSTASLIHRQ